MNNGFSDAVYDVSRRSPVASHALMRSLNSTNSNVGEVSHFWLTPIEAEVNAAASIENRIGTPSQRSRGHGSRSD